MTKEIEIILNRPHKGQQQVLAEAKRFNVLACGRRWGKSKLAENLLIEPALTGKPTSYFTPTYKLLEITYKEVLKKCEPILRRKHENQHIELITGGSIEFWSMDNPLSGRSRKYARTVLDEVAFQAGLMDRWNEAVRATLTDLKGDAWFMSSPKGKNDFYKLWMNGRSGKEGWASWQMPTSTNPFIDISEIQDAQQDLPAMAFAQEYLAEFNDNAANPFGADFIKMCIYPISTEPAICYAIDLAKSHDYTVIIGLDKAGQVCHFQRFQKDWRQTIAEINSLPNAEIIIDSTGVGDPIAEEVARVRNVEMFKFTSISKQQIMEGLASAIQQRKITFPDGAIVDELNSFEYNYTPSGVKYSAPQGLHDDCVCALAMAWKKFSTAKTYGEINVW